MPEEALAGIVDISDVVFAYAHKIREDPARAYCSSVTVQSMLDFKLRGRDPTAVYSIPLAGTTVADLIQKVQGKHNIGSQILVNEAGTPVGFVTERDIITKVWRRGSIPPHLN